MRLHRKTVIAGIWIAVVALAAWAQAPKAGLYQVTHTMTWQKSPFPADMQIKPGTGGPHTAQTCITQAQIDKYSGPKPTASGGCEITNIRKRPNGMTADMTCTGSTRGKGTVETHWTNSRHSKSKVHFTGEMQMGQQTKPVEWTLESESTYKGADCGAVKPLSD